MADPLYLPITKAARVFGISRPNLYGLVKAGHIQAVRHGCLSMVNMDSARAYFASLPSIVIAPPSRAPPRNARRQCSSRGPPQGDQTPERTPPPKF
jgi:hypothetical protein